MKTSKALSGLLAMTVGLAVLPVAAQTATTSATTTVTVYGLIDAVVRRASNANAAKDSLTSMEDGLITGSRLGFRGTEDLGGGLRAILNMESGFDVGTGASLQGTTVADYGQEAVSPRFWGREIYVGLGSSWGTITAGHQYTTAHQIAIRFQPLGNPNFAALSLFSSHHIPRQDNLLRVETKIGDVDLQASRTFGEQATSSSANSSWAIGGGYRKGDLTLGGYVQQMDNRAGSETRRIVGVGGNYRFNPTFALFAAYMQRSAAVSPQENKVWALGANIELSPEITLSLRFSTTSRPAAPR